MAGTINDSVEPGEVAETSIGLAYASVPVEEVRVGRIRFEGRNKAVFNIGSKYTVVLVREKRQSEGKGGDISNIFTIILLEVTGEGAVPKPPIIWNDSESEDVLSLKLEGIDISEAEAVANAIAQIARYFDAYRLGYEAELLAIKQRGFEVEELKKLSAIAIASKPNPREELVETLASLILSRMHLLSFDPKRGPLLCYKEGIYQECDKEVTAEIERLVEGSELRAKVTNRTISEVMGKLYRRAAGKALKDIEKVKADRFYLAFKNGLFNVREWVLDGIFTLKPFDPSIYAIHRIPHNLNVELFREMMRDEGLEILTHPVDIAALAEKYTPKTWKAYNEWVNDPEKAALLYEIEGYTLYPDYPLHKAFVLLGEGANGKSTYLRKLETVLGEDNVVSVSLIEILDSSRRFDIAELYRKLANIAGEVPSGKVLDKVQGTDLFKRLTGQDKIKAERKYRDPFYFYNYAKMIFSANRLPKVKENTHGFWRRWIGLEFPNQFPEDPTFFDRTFTKYEVEAGIIISLLALRNVMLRRAFTESGLDIKERWKRLSDSVYRFVKEMVEAGYLVLSPKAYVEKQELYSFYVKWANDADEIPEKQKSFTQTLKREFGVVTGKERIRGKRRNAYIGIGILRNPYKEEEEEDQGILGWS